MDKINGYHEQLSTPSLQHKLLALYKNTFYAITKFQTDKKQIQKDTLLSVLADSSVDYSFVDYLGKHSGLEAAVSPILANLDREGLVEHAWLQTPNGSRLAYKLTPAGNMHIG